MTRPYFSSTMTHFPSSSTEDDEKCNQLLFVSCYSDFDRLGTNIEFYFISIFEMYLELYCAHGIVGFFIFVISTWTARDPSQTPHLRLSIKRFGRQHGAHECHGRSQRCYESSFHKISSTVSISF